MSFDIPVTPPAPERNPNRTAMIALLIGGGVIGLLLIVAGVAGLAWAFLGQRSNNIPELLSAETQIYGAITPSLQDVPNIDRLRRAFPEIDYEQGEPSSDLLAEELGVSFAADIAPWIGAEMAFAASGLPFDASFDPESLDPEAVAEDVELLLLLAARDEEQAQAFLEKQRAHREGEGQSFGTREAAGVTITFAEGGEPSPIAAFALVRGHVVFANSADVIAALAAREPGADDSLAASPRFQAVSAALPEGRLGFIYVDGPPIAQAMRENLDDLDEFEEALSAAGTVSLEDQLATMDAMRGMGFAISALADGLAFDAIGSFDQAALPQTVREQIAAQSVSVPAERVAAISETAVAALSFHIPMALGDQILNAIDADPSIAEQVASFEDELGLSLERDLLSWFHGDATLVLLPGEQVVDTELPVTGYFALRSGDLAAAEASVERIVAVLEEQSGGELGLRSEAIGGADWQVFGPEQELFGGYAFVGEELLIGVGPSALALATDAGAPLGEQQPYQAAAAALPSPNAGLLYVDLPALVDLAEEQGGLSAEDAERLQPFRALTAAGSPGLSDEGVARGRLFLVIGAP